MTRIEAMEAAMVAGHARLQAAGYIVSLDDFADALATALEKLADLAAIRTYVEPRRPFLELD